MKKIILIILVLSIIVGVMAGCNNNVNPDKNVADQPTVNDGQKPTENANNKEDINSYILSLKPTHTTASDYPFIGWDDWSIGHDFRDLSHLNEGYYRFRISYEYASSKFGNEWFEGTWEEIKNLPVEQVGEYSSSCPIHVKYIKEDGEDGLAIKYELDENLTNMTIQEAIEDGYWHYVEDTFGFKFSYKKFFEEEPEGEYVKRIIEAWGMPSEVSYMLYEDRFAMFLMEYQTEDYVVYLEGFEYFNVEDGDDAMGIRSITVCGKNAEIVKSGNIHYNTKLN